MVNLKWWLPITVIYPISCPLQADMLGSFSASTNYLWRGVTQTDDNPSASVSVEFHNRYGGYLGAWASNTDYGDASSYEVNLYLGRKVIFEPVEIELGVRHYYFPKGGKFRYDFMRETWDTGSSDAFTEFQLGLRRNKWHIGYAYSNNYLAGGNPGYYLELDYLQPLTRRLSLELHYGSQTSDAIHDTPEHRVGDFRATLMWRRFSFTASNLTDNVDGRQSDKIRYVLGWRRRFGGHAVQ